MASIAQQYIKYLLGAGCLILIWRRCVLPAKSSRRDGCKMTRPLVRIVRKYLDAVLVVALVVYLFE
jgi:hypothetical protein